MTLEEKRKLREKMMKDVNKEFGVGTLVAGDKLNDQQFYPTGIPSIDNALGGGLAKGRMFSIYGEPSAGKSTLMLQAIAYNQKIDPDFMALYVDQENAGFTKKYAQTLGVDLSRMDYMEADIAEKTTTAMREMISTGIYNLIILDSTNALVPEGEMKKDVSATGNTMAEVARLLSKWCRQTCLQIAKPKTTVVCIEQTREKPGAMTIPGAPTPVAIGCGKAVGFYCSQRLELKKGKPLKDGEMQTGQYVRFKCVKNKVDIPNIKGETIMTNGIGFDPDRDAEEFLLQMFIAQADPAFVQVSKVKWEFRNPNGAVVEIKGKGNILQSLKDANMLQDAIEIAKKCATDQGKKNKAGSEEYEAGNVAADAYEGAKEIITDDDILDEDMKEES